VKILLPWFNLLVDTSVSMHFDQASFWILIASVFLGLSLLAGIYPALLLSSFSVSKVIKGQLSNHLNTVTLRKGLVVFQFLISALLIIGAVTMRKQLHYLQTKDIGLERGNVIVVSANDQLIENYKIFKEQLQQNPNIEIVSASSHSPISVGMSTGDPTWDGFTEDKRAISLVSGRFPDNNRKADSTAIIINETVANVIGIENPVGKKMTFWGEDWTIVGVVKDFHIASLHSTIAPLIMVHGENWINEIYVRPAGTMKDAIAVLSNAHAELASAYPLEYTFLDKQYKEMYQLEETTGALADLFAIIALFISALGLLGLAAFSAERRLKEVGIRKVLGASVPNLIALLSKDFLKLVLLALLIAIPLGWYGMNQYLQNYSYHINIDWTVFAIMIGAALLVAIITVGIQAFRAAITNPIDTIKIE